MTEKCYTIDMFLNFAPVVKSILLKEQICEKVYLVFILPTQLAFMLCNLRLQFIRQTWKLSEDSVHMQWIRAEILLHSSTVNLQRELCEFTQSSERIFPAYQLHVFPVKLVSYQLELLADAGLHTVSHRLLPWKPLHPVSLPFGLSPPCFLITN